MITVSPGRQLATVAVKRPAGGDVGHVGGDRRGLSDRVGADDAGGCERGHTEQRGGCNHQCENETLHVRDPSSRDHRHGSSGRLFGSRNGRDPEVDDVGRRSRAGAVECGGMPSPPPSPSTIRGMSSTGPVSGIRGIATALGPCCRFGGAGRRSSVDHPGGDRRTATMWR